jgi:hypothetical protein
MFWKHHSILQGIAIFFFFLKRIDITRYRGIIILMGIDILRNGKQPNKKIIIL